MTQFTSSRLWRPTHESSGTAIDSTATPPPGPPLDTAGPCGFYRRIPLRLLSYNSPLGLLAFFWWFYSLCILRPQSLLFSFSLSLQKSLVFSEVDRFHPTHRIAHHFANPAIKYFSDKLSDDHASSCGLSGHAYSRYGPLDYECLAASTSAAGAGLRKSRRSTK